MKGMLRVEGVKWIHSSSLWVILGVLVVSCGVSVLSGVYPNMEILLDSLSRDSMVPILACAVYSAICLTDDFSNGMVRHFIANGYKRPSILAAKYLYYLLGCCLLLFLYPCLCVGLAALVQGGWDEIPLVLARTGSRFLLLLPLYLGIFSLFFAISIWVKKGAVAMGISVASSILLVVFTNRLYGNGIELFRYSPVIQIGRAWAGAPLEYGIAAGISLLFALLFVWGSMVKFQREEW